MWDYLDSKTDSFTDASCNTEPTYVDVSDTAFDGLILPLPQENLYKINYQYVAADSSGDCPEDWDFESIDHITYFLIDPTS